jgi:hypothetical protein
MWRIPRYRAYPCMYGCLPILGDWVRIYSSMCHGTYTYTNIWGLLLLRRGAITIIAIYSNYKNENNQIGI